MESLTLVLGIALLMVALLDMLWTTLWVSGSAGPVTRTLASAGWAVTRRVSRGSPTLMSLYGPISIIGAIVAWSGLLWIGWALVFSSDATAIRDTHSGVPGDWIDVVYYTGYAIFTMGNGDLTPAPEWRIATTLMNASGLILLTLAVSYLLSVVSAVVDMRAFATRVTTLASEPLKLVRAGWTDGSLASLEPFLASRHAELSNLTAQHAAYPVLRYFHPSDRSKAAPPAVVTLDEALTTIEAVVPEPQRPSPITMMALRGAIGDYIGAMAVEVRAEVPVPSAPKFERLAEEGMPVELEGADEVLGACEDRRRQLVALMDHYGWDWKVDVPAS